MIQLSPHVIATAICAQRKVVASQMHIQHSNTAARNRNAGTLNEEDVQKMIVPVDLIKNYRNDADEILNDILPLTWESNSESGYLVCN